MTQRYPDPDKPFAVYVLWGPDPEDPEKGTGSSVLMVDDEVDNPEMALVHTLLEVTSDHLRSLKKGGTCSLMFTRGKPGVDGPDTYAHGSFVVNNPGGDRHSWDFYVEKRDAFR